MKKKLIIKAIAAAVTTAFFWAVHTNQNPKMWQIALFGILFFEIGQGALSEIWEEMTTDYSDKKEERYTSYLLDRKERA